MKFLSQNHEKLVLGVSLWLLGRPLGPQGRQRRKSGPKGGSWDPPPQEGPFFFWSLRDTKKGGPGRPSKIGPFFGRFWGLPGGPQEGSRLDGSSIFTFAAGPKKGSKMRAKMELFGLPNPHYTHFGASLGRNGCPKRGVKKRLQKTAKN